MFIISVMTADGYIGRDEHHLATSWTSHADKVFFTKKTKQAGVVVMGRNTYQTFNSALPKRRLIVLTSDPPALDTPEGVEATNESLQVLIERLKNEGVAEVAIAGGASVYAQFMQAELVDELFVTVEPTLFGTGVPFFGQELHTKLQLAGLSELGDGVALLHYRVMK